MNWPFGKKWHDVDPENHVKLIVTGVCKESDKNQIIKDCKDKGVKAVVTSAPVLGVFDIK